MRRAIEERAIDYAVAVDNDYAVWSAFANHSWPALYFVDTDGVIRDHHFGEGRYEQSERVIQRLLGVDREPVSVEAVGVEAPADWDHLHTPETYLGYARGDRAGHWAVAGEWTIAAEAVVLDAAGGSLTCRFHARDAHLVLSRRARQPIAYRVLLDGEPPGPSHGVDIDEHGTGVLRDARMYQLVPQHDAIRDRTLQITFLEPGAEAYDAHSASRRWRPASWRAHRAPSPSGRRPDRSRQESIHPGARPVTHGRDRRPVAKPLRRCPKGLESEAR